MNTPYDVSRVIKEFELNKDFIFFDLGSHIGQELEALLPLGIEVHGFEPHPKRAELIREKFGNFDNLIFNEKAAWTKNENKIFYHISHGTDMWWYATGSSLIKEKVNVDKNHTIEVACIDLSEYIFNLQKRINILIKKFRKNSKKLIS